MTADVNLEPTRTLSNVIETITNGDFYKDYDQSVADLAILRDARASRGGAVAAPEGWQLVPIKPTDDMLEDADRARAQPEHYIRDVYTAVLAAAPTPPAAEAPGQEPVAMTYTNWRGETHTRRVLPLSIWFGTTEWHPDPQWFLRARDVDRGVERDFALKDFGKPTP